MAQIVMTTAFDVNRLSAQQISALLKDGKDLRRFKNAVLSIAATIPNMNNPDERERRLKAAAAEIVNEWAKYRRSLPRFAAEAISDATNVKVPDLAISAITGAAGSYLSLGVGAGLAVSLLTLAGLKGFLPEIETKVLPIAFHPVFDHCGYGALFVL